METGFILSFYPEFLYFRMLKLMVFFPETRSFFFCKEIKQLWVGVS